MDKYIVVESEFDANKDSWIGKEAFVFKRLNDAEKFFNKRISKYEYERDVIDDIICGLKNYSGEYTKIGIGYLECVYKIINHKTSFKQNKLCGIIIGEFVKYA